MEYLWEVFSDLFIPLFVIVTVIGVGGVVGSWLWRAMGGVTRDD